MPHYSTFTILDYGGEKSSFQFNHGALTVASLPGFLTGFGALRTALDAIISGTLNKEKIVLDDTLLSSAAPASPYAQREMKMLIVYRDTTSNKQYQMTVPTPDLSVLTIPPSSGDYVTLADGGVMAAFVTALETIGRSPEDDTHNIEVVSARIVGRNL